MLEKFYYVHERQPIVIQEDCFYEHVFFGDEKQYLLFGASLDAPLHHYYQQTERASLVPGAALVRCCGSISGDALRGPLQ